MRDYGPIFVERRMAVAATVEFNAWGGKYDDLIPDNRPGSSSSSRPGCRSSRPGVVLEGGSIDVNGQRDVLTTEQCLLNKNRNPHLGKARARGGSSTTTSGCRAWSGWRQGSRGMTRTAT